MSYCGSRTIAMREGERATAFPLRCRSWSCPTCAPRRRKQLINQAKQGNPDRFVTLTVNPSWFSSPEERGAKIAWAWREFVRWWRAKHPSSDLQYLAVVETTKLGEPHLHIMVRGPFISQKQLSAWMNAKIGAPITDIRLVRGKRDVARYVTKYISKRPIRLGTMKRYWRSARYLDPEAEKARKAAKAGRAVWLVEMTVDEFKAALLRSGHVVWERFPGDVSWRMFPWEPRPPTVSTLSRRVH